jgi:hypothetical protein
MMLGKANDSEDSILGISVVFFSFCQLESGRNAISFCSSSQFVNQHITNTLCNLLFSFCGHRNMELLQVFDHLVDSFCKYRLTRYRILHSAA